jgi:hypothetical protein
MALNLNCKLAAFDLTYAARDSAKYSKPESEISTVVFRTGGKLHLREKIWLIFKYL